MTPRFVNQKEKKKQIIEATIHILSNKNMQDFKLQDVAQYLNIGKSTIYEYFENKEAIIVQSMDYFMEKYFIYESEEQSVFKLLENALWGFQRVDEKDARMMRVIMDLWTQGIKGNYPGLKRFYQKYIRYAADKIHLGQKKGEIRNDIDPESTAAWVLGVMDGLGLQILLDPEHFDYQGIFNSFMQAMRDFLCPSRGE